MASANRLGLVINAARTDGVDVSPVLLGLRADLRVAIDFRGGGQQEDAPVGFCQSQRMVGSQRSHLKSVNRVPGIVLRAGRRCKVQNVT